MTASLELREQFGILLGETTRALRTRIDRRLKPLGFSQAKWLVLLQLLLAEKRGETFAQTDLAARLGIESPSLVGLLDRLQRDGMIERRDSAADRRRKTVHLTETGRAQSQDIRDAACAVRDATLAGASEEELAICVRVLSRMKTNLETL